MAPLFLFLSFFLLSSLPPSLSLSELEYPILVHHQHDQDLLLKLSQLGVHFDHPRRDSSSVSGVALDSQLQSMRDMGVKFEILEEEMEARKRFVQDLYKPDTQEGSKVRRETNGFATLPFEFSFDRYHHHRDTTAFLFKIAQHYPHIAKLESIGQSEEGREIWAMRITDKPHTEENNEAKIKYIANMHGDEVVGKELMLRLIAYLCTGYGGDKAVSDLVNSTDIYIVPTMNPDGFEACRRSNANGNDLNRSFPDHIKGYVASPIPREAEMIMAWSRSKAFSLSINFHGGDEVVNYPFDGNTSNILEGLYSRCPDDDLFIKIAQTYADQNSKILANTLFTNGITNGSQWYTLYGGMQDWNYLETGCMELTVELSMDKVLNKSKLEEYWEYNINSFMAHMPLVNQLGVRGRLTDKNGVGIAGRVNVVGIDVSVMSNSLTGHYVRMLLPGRYTLTATAHGYLESSKEVVVEEGSQTTLNFVLDEAEVAKW